MQKINQRGKVRARRWTMPTAEWWTMQQQTRAIHIARANHRKSQMIKRNHRFIFSKVNGSMVFVTIAWRPLVAISSSDTLRISALACICPEPSPAVSAALVFYYLP